jgi:hypothetical protein
MTIFSGGRRFVSDFDSPWKEALDVYFELFLAFFFPQVHDEIDWTRGYEVLDKELQQVVREAELGRRVVDKLVKVWRRDGQEEWVLIHVEVQTQEETDFSERMYVYNYRLFDRYNRKVVSLAVLGDERLGWRPTRFGYSLWGCTIAFQFPVVKLLDYAADEAGLEANPNPFATLVLAHLKTQQTRHDPEARRVWKVRLFRRLLDRGLSGENIRQLFRFIDWMMDLPEELAGQFWEEVHQYEEEKRMPYMMSNERLARKQELLAGIGQCLKLKFGAEGLQLLPELRQITDVVLLRAVLDAFDTASSLDDLRRIWSPGGQGQAPTTPHP